ncbi:hypothetical protein, partial [Novacetimonas maltaceti]
RRLDAIAKTVNQIAKTQKLPAKHINQGFFDPSICWAIGAVCSRGFRNAGCILLLTFMKTLPVTCPAAKSVMKVSQDRSVSRWMSIGKNC